MPRLKKYLQIDLHYIYKLTPVYLSIYIYLSIYLSIYLYGTECRSHLANCRTSQDVGSQRIRTLKESFKNGCTDSLETILPSRNKNLAVVVKNWEQINYLNFLMKFWFTKFRKFVNIKWDFHFFQLLTVCPHLVLLFIVVELSKVVMKQRQYNNAIWSHSIKAWPTS